MGAISQRFFAEYGIESVVTSGGNPNSNGSAERMIGFINRKLARNVKAINGTDWADVAVQLQLAISASPIRGLNISPYELTYGQQPPSLQAPQTWTRFSTPEELALKRSTLNDRLVEDVIAFRTERKAHTKRMKEAACTTFAAGDRVYLYVGNDTEAGARKLGNHFHGPFVVKPSMPGDHTPLV